MATVYLPFGYPLQSGGNFSVVLYQGNMVRAYTTVSDPRTASQLFERRFLADMTRMRSTLSAWGKGLCNRSMGTSWGTVLYQLIKSDLDGAYSDALDTWAELDPGVVSDWRELAPFQATYNDPGKVWFCLARCMSYALGKFGSYDWLSVPLSSNDGENARQWWDGTLDWQWLQGEFDDTLALLGPDSANYQRVYDVDMYGGSCLTMSGQISFSYYGRKFAIRRYYNFGQWLPIVSVDGVQLTLPVSTDNWMIFVPQKKGFHVVTVVGNLSTMSFDAFRVY